MPIEVILSLPIHKTLVLNADFRNVDFLALHILVHSLKLLKRSISSMNTFLPAEEKYSSAKIMRVVAVPSNHWF